MQSGRGLVPQLSAFSGEKGQGGGRRLRTKNLPCHRERATSLARAVKELTLWDTRTAGGADRTLGSSGGRRSRDPIRFDPQRASVATGRLLGELGYRPCSSKKDGYDLRFARRARAAKLLASGRDSRTQKIPHTNNRNTSVSTTPHPIFVTPIHCSLTPFLPPPTLNPINTTPTYCRGGGPPN